MVIASLFLMVDGYWHKQMLFLKYHEQKYLIVFCVIFAVETYETVFKKRIRLLIMIYQ